MQYSCEKSFCATQTNDSSYLVCIKNSATGGTCRAGTAYISGTPAFTPRVLVVFVFLQSLVFCVVFCRSLFVLFLLAIILSVILFPSSDCLCGIYQTFRVDSLFGFWTKKILWENNWPLSAILRLPSLLSLNCFYIYTWYANCVDTPVCIVSSQLGIPHLCETQCDVQWAWWVDSLNILLLNLLYYLIIFNFLLMEIPKQYDFLYYSIFSITRTIHNNQDVTMN